MTLCKATELCTVVKRGPEITAHGDKIQTLFHPFLRGWDQILEHQLCEAPSSPPGMEKERK